MLRELATMGGPNELPNEDPDKMHLEVEGALQKDEPTIHVAYT